MKLSGVVQNLSALVIVLVLAPTTTFGAPIDTYPSGGLEVRSPARYTALLLQKLNINVDELGAEAKAFAAYMNSERGKAFLRGKIPILYTGSDSMALRQGILPNILNFKALDPKNPSPSRYIHQDLREFKSTFEKTIEGKQFITINDVEEQSGINTRRFTAMEWAFSSFKYVEAGIAAAKAVKKQPEFKLILGNEANPESLFAGVELPAMLLVGTEPETELPKIESYVCVANTICGQPYTLDVDSLRSQIAEKFKDIESLSKDID